MSANRAPAEGISSPNTLNDEKASPVLPDALVQSAPEIDQMPSVICRHAGHWRLND